MAAPKKGHALRITFDGKEVFRLMDRMKSAIDGPRRKRIMNMIATSIYSISRDSFKKAEDPVTGTKWKKSPDWWVEWKKKEGFSPKLLHMRSIMQGTGKFSSTPRWARVDYTSAKASIHNDGGHIGYNRKTKVAFRVPQRRFLGLSDKDKQEIVGELDRMFREAAKS